jgi:hypothetical protein
MTVIGSIQQSRLNGDRATEWPLGILGGVLLVIGFLNGPGSILLSWLRVLASDWWWISGVIVFAAVFQRDVLRYFGCALSSLLVLIWLAFRAGDLMIVALDSASRVGENAFGFMLAVLGGLLLFAKHSSSTAGVIKTIAQTVRNRRKTAIFVCLTVLWFANPAHSHSLCLKASQVCEDRGQYECAIALTVLARDTFPAPTFCITCYAEGRRDLTWRIARIEAKQAGRLPSNSIEEIALGRGSPSVRAMQRNE